ncbi:CPBP family intramembrane metalloprotease [Muricauda sp. TY007]|uniref:CPBP family glutamic-type intramembrane protease n=1 Tax=Allomuricauda sp. TY007 TaxID=2683200 RepID=UPI0013C088BB|nr:CPBP family glutamic-type intramembrane protease [Muricauda sp. TY007]NDV15384.1 CPBP family intramembrane metalloprotease [Muricauda sp. TY007]
MKPTGFIFTTLILNFLLLIPIFFFLIYFDISEDEIGGIDISKYSIWRLFLVAVILAPLIETFIGQLLPIKLIQKILGEKFRVVALFISAIIFSLGHFGYSIWYSIIMLPMGFLLGETYIIFQKRKESGFWMTSAVHSLRNLIAVIVIFSENL